MKLLLKDTEVAEMLGLSRAFVWQSAARGKFPKPIKIGGAARWHASEIDAFVASRPRSGTGEDVRGARERRGAKQAVT